MVLNTKKYITLASILILFTVLVFFGNKFFNKSEKDRVKSEEPITINLLTSVHPSLPWRFKAIETKISTLSLGTNPEIDASNEFSNTILDIKMKSIYGANWPYDYFSLVETVKIDVEVEVSS